MSFFKRRDEGLPPGNGKTGSIVYGSSPLKTTKTTLNKTNLVLGAVTRDLKR